MTELVLATNNKGKTAEIEALIEGVNLLCLKDIGFTAEIEEPFFTFEENALAKASAIYEFCGKNVIADDSGICVNALNGRPGVDSAHYSGSRDDEANLRRLLTDLEGVTDRSAFYKAVICLIWEGETWYFEGICEGTIIDEKRGEGGFGYDPIFVPDGYSGTFAQFPLHQKNAISHRAKAVNKLIAFLKDHLTE